MAERAADREVTRLRTCREAFALAMARGISVSAAKVELARARWASIDTKLAERRCGTLTPPPTAGGDGERALQWWQR